MGPRDGRDSSRGGSRGGYSRDDAARDTGSSRSDVDRAWGDAARDGGNGHGYGADVVDAFDIGRDSGKAKD